jgi:hypothetical protein
MSNSKPNKNQKEQKIKKTPSLYDEYLKLLEEKKNNKSYLIDDGSVLMMKFDEVIRDIEVVRQDVRKAANGIVSAHTRMRKQFRTIYKNLKSMVNLSLSMERARELERQQENSVKDIELEEES